MRLMVCDLGAFVVIFASAYVATEEPTSFLKYF